MSGQLGQSEFEDLVAYLDGELDARRAAEVRKLVETGPAWREAHRQMRELDAALDLYAAPPAPSDLAERICRNVRRKSRQPLVIRIVRWAAPLAAAAAILLFVVLSRPWDGGQGTGQGGPGLVRPADVISPEDVERIARDNLDFFQELDVVANLDTLEEIERLEGESNGT